MNFDDKTPVVIAEYVRFWLGDVPVSILSEETLLKIINLTIERLDDTATGCDIIYYSTIDVLKWLIRENEQGNAGSSSAGSGALKKITEKVSEITVTKEYDVGTSVENASASGWDRVLEDLLNNSSSIGCAITQSPSAATSTGNVLIGGVSQAERDRISNDSDAVNGFSLSSPFRSYMNNSRNLIG